MTRFGAIAARVVANATAAQRASSERPQPQQDKPQPQGARK